jgi:hypothetical protein
MGGIPWMGETWGKKRRMNKTGKWLIPDVRVNVYLTRPLFHWQGDRRRTVLIVCPLFTYLKT